MSSEVKTQTRQEFRQALRMVRETRRFGVDTNSLVEVAPTSEQRAEVQDGGVASIKFRGLASRTNSKYSVADYYGEYTETIMKNAFRTTLNENPEVQLLINHEGIPLANTRSSTMKIWESDRGLEFEATLALANPDAQRVISGLQRGDLHEASFAFRVTPSGQSWNEDYTDRVITQVSLHRGDISVVAYGANPNTDLELSRKDEDEEMDDPEREDDDEMSDELKQALLLQQQLEEAEDEIYS